MIDLPLFPTPDEADQLAGYLRQHGWQCTPPGGQRPGRVRRADHATSRRGADQIRYRAGSQKAILLHAYYPLGGLTDEEAAYAADLLKACYWKRCGELREDGLIEVVTRDGVPATRPGAAGSERIVCHITPAGTALITRLKATVSD